MNTVITIIDFLNDYLSALDWTYIFTFILIAYGLNLETTRMKLRWLTRISLARRYRVAIAGILYAIILAWIRGNYRSQAEVLLPSFVFALVFHKLIIDKTIAWLSQRFFQTKTKSHEN